jgi:hypothetical protein
MEWPGRDSFAVPAQIWVLHPFAAFAKGWKGRMLIGDEFHCLRILAYRHVRISGSFMARLQIESTA